VKVKLGLNSEVNDIKSRIPTEYQQFLNIFKERMAAALMPHHTFDHDLDWKDGMDSS
jgi:hypothetical protein